MLKATLIESAAGPLYNKWQIHFHEPQNKEWDGDFVGNVYRNKELQQNLGLDSYEFYYYDPTTSEIINMIFINQLELMKFLTHVGNEKRAQAARKQKGIWE